MFVLSHFLMAAAKILDVALSIYTWIIIARAVLSWVNPDPYNAVVRFVYSVTEPVLSAIRRRIPTMFGSMDFTPVVVLLAIVFLQNFLVASLRDMALRIAV